MRTRESPPIRKLGHEVALDGIRGVAVILVLIWHYIGDIYPTPVPWYQAGHLGVDLFFVLSGFLITALMLNEHHREGSISFRGFYRRRFFRLIPALVLFLTAHFIWAASTDIESGFFKPGTELSNEIASVIGALFFSINLIPMVSDYRTTLGMGHLWSLAVEEQFYLIWPLLNVALLNRNTLSFTCGAAAGAAAVAITGHFLMWDELDQPLRTGLTLATGLGVLATLYHLRRRGWEVPVLATAMLLIAAVLMFRLGFQGGSAMSKLGLYGSLTARADSLLFGALLAYLWVSGRIARRCPTPVSVAAWVVFGWCVTSVSLEEPFFFEWGWSLVAVCGALITWGALGSVGTVYGTVLSWGWLRSIGKVAYGLYLWHAAVFIAVQHALADHSLLLRTVIALTITAGITAASWFFVERPMLAYKSARGPAPKRS